MNYYNEYDAGAAAWLRELINQNLIPYGHVDTRSITEVKPDDLKGYTQCHFFAGIGGWSYALQLAGWPTDRPVWTGSCPCQPFSVAGKGKGVADERHLWPVFFELIRQCRPEHVFGEQVASAINHGWLDGVSADLEAEGYACGATVLGAHSVGAPHIRQRLYWVADRQSLGLEGGWGENDRGSLAGVRERGAMDLGVAAHLAGWPTATTTRDWKSGKSNLHGKNARPLSEVAMLAGGVQQTSNAETEKPGASRLNPLFSLWLMGYPAEWGYCGARAMQSFRKSRRSSSLRSLTAKERSPSKPKNGCEESWI
jgi:site-specific DNA-cytosine methylase